MSPAVRTYVKVCGLTRVSDAEACVAAGVDAIGLNFWPGSSRHVGADAAAEIVRAVRGRVRVVGLFVDASGQEILSLKRQVGFDWVQLHGDETPQQLQQQLPQAFKALRVRGADVAQEAARYAGDLLLLDAYVPGQVGGTGETFDWTLAARIARSRKVLVAGGLTPSNVAAAVAAVHPYGVDTASGVESAVGIKDEALVRRFVQAARSLDADREG